MIALLFATTCLLFGFQAGFFLWRFVHHQAKYSTWNLSSLVCAFNAIGWVFAVGRELKLVPRAAASPLLSAALAFGILGVACILHTQAQYSKGGKP